MLKFDKIKIVTDIQDITIIDPSSFEATLENGKVKAQKYHQEVPSLLNVKVDYVENEAVLEFTGKVLGERYPELITINTIRDCFEAINQLGFCCIDIDAILEHADVVKCDVTCDINCGDIQSLCSYMRMHITNYSLYRCALLRNGNMVIEKNVTSDKCKKRMVIYDKGKEMNKAINKDFVEANHLEGAFDGKCRFEINLNSKQQIRDSLNVSNTKLMTVLAATANPISEFVSQVVTSQSSDVKCSSFKEYYQTLILKDCDYDLAKVEARLRSLYGAGRSIPKMMQVYRDLLDKNNGKEENELFLAATEQLS